MRLAVLLAVAVAGCTHARPPAPPPAAPLADIADIDALTAQAWAAANVEPAPPAGDAEYLRRVTLDLAGRVPSVEEAETFLADRAPDKRRHLVERLLGSPDFAEAWADVYADLYVGRGGGEPFARKARAGLRGWLVASLARGTPHDQIADALLTATGDIDEHAEGAFLLVHGRQGGGPEGAAAASARVFLGLQLQCAQCHDHPYDPRYKQEDFYGLAAYFARTRVQRRQIVNALFGQIKMKKHGSGEEVVVKPRFLGRAVAPADDETRRRALARAVVGSDLFAKAAVNHAWAQLFGRGLVEPWDDLGGENDPGHPALLVHLAADFRSHGYDLRRLLATIVLSAAYARSSTGGSDGADAVFARAAVRPLSPEQLYRSLLAATRLAEAASRRVGAEQVARLVERGQNEYLFVFGDEQASEREGSVDTFAVPQALLLWNGEVTSRGLRGQPGTALADIVAEARAPEARLERLFLTALARPPTAAERARLKDRAASRQGCADLFYALLTSTEFTTNH